MHMRSKLFVGFVALSLVTLLLLWSFQIFMLDTMYYQLTKSRMSSLSNQIETLYSENDKSFSQNISAMAVDNEFCIYIFDKRGAPIANAHPSSGCIIHGINSEKLTELYHSATEAGGDYFHRANLNGFQSENSGRLRFSHSKYSVRDRILNVSVKDTEKGSLIIMLDAAITPVNIIKTALTIQLFITTIVTAILASIVANVTAKKLSQPITDVNRAAKRLTRGEYDIKFTGDGYREIYELSDTLNQTAKDLRKTDELQKELIANISHDLRTPLTLITGYCEMMRDIEGENTPENMQVVIDETARLSSLVNDLVDLSKYQGGGEKLDIEEVDIDLLLLETAERYRKLMQEKEYTFIYESIGETIVKCDKKRILQVVYNLINNAINYAGDDKTVIIEARRLENGKTRIEITDHGEGIPGDALPYIFDRYYKVDKVHKRAVTGTGLGLSIVKTILERHGATYGVRSEVGMGSTFFFEV